MVPADAPQYDVDLYDEDLVADPYPHYKAIRDLGRAVWLPKNEMWALGRYDDIRAALKASEVLISGKGVSNNRFMNNELQVATLVSDGDRHRLHRGLVMKPIMASQIKVLRSRVEATAEALIDGLLGRHVEGVTEIAQIIPLDIVSHLVGLPEAGRENMLKWAAATFDTLGSLNKLARQAIPVVQESFSYTQALTRADVVPGGWADQLFDAADNGTLAPEDIPGLLQDYIAPSLDTAIFSIGHMLHKLGRHPEQWAQIRADPALIPGTVNEVVRIESPIRAFTRYAKEDYVVGAGTHEARTLPQGSRVAVIYASANHDERHYDHPDTFDIHRKNTDHLGFGYGVHTCLGRHLAKLELTVLLETLARKVERIEVGDPVYVRNNVLRGFDSLPVKLS